MALDLPPLDADPKDYDYKVRCEELEAALNETRSALDEFQLSSRELEAELEKELENMEKQYKEAKRQKERLKMESDEWKVRSPPFPHLSFPRAFDPKCAFWRYGFWSDWLTGG